MADTNADVWLIVPVFNEASVVRGVIEQAREHFVNVLCIDDGSSDDSGDQALLAGAVVLRHPINLGQGAAIQTGLQFALAQTQASYFVTFDSDGQHSAADAAKMVERLRSEPFDIILGSRFLDGGTNAGRLKVFVLRLAVFFERVVTGVKLTDAHNGLRALNRKAASQITIRQNRMAHASEIVAQIRAHGLRYSEEPVYIAYTEYSRRKGQSLWNSVNILSDLFIR